MTGENLFMSLFSILGAFYNNKKLFIEIEHLLFLNNVKVESFE